MSDFAETIDALYRRLNAVQAAIDYLTPIAEGHRVAVYHAWPPGARHEPKRRHHISDEARLKMSKAAKRRWRRLKAGAR